MQVTDSRCARCVLDNVDNLITGFHEVWFPSIRGFLPSLFRRLFVMFQLANTVPRTQSKKTGAACFRDMDSSTGRQTGLLLSKVRIHLLLAAAMLSRIHYFALPVGQARWLSRHDSQTNGAHIWCVTCLDHTLFDL
jgi:hypothetical protein